MSWLALSWLALSCFGTSGIAASCIASSGLVLVGGQHAKVWLGSHLRRHVPLLGKDQQDLVGEQRQANPVPSRNSLTPQPARRVEQRSRLDPHLLDRTGFSRHDRADPPPDRIVRLAGMRRRRAPTRSESHDSFPPTAGSLLHDRDDVPLAGIPLWRCGSAPRHYAVPRADRTHKFSRPTHKLEPARFEPWRCRIAPQPIWPVTNESALDRRPCSPCRSSLFQFRSQTRESGDTAITARVVITTTFPIPIVRTGRLRTSSPLNQVGHVLETTFYLRKLGLKQPNIAGRCSRAMQLHARVKQPILCLAES